MSAGGWVEGGVEDVEGLEGRGDGAWRDGAEDLEGGGKGAEGGAEEGEEGRRGSHWM